MSQAPPIVIDNQTWTLGRSLGSGGFGRVYRARSGSNRGAIKLVPKDPGAELELLVVDNLRGAVNVLPVWGRGDTGTFWAILMPLAEQSLRAHLENGQLSEDETRSILIDVAQALFDVQKAGIVHRDLKPENVLLYEGRWCLSDFGIARYVEAAERLDTRKYSTTKPYAAPEQWRDEEVTSATDMYAFGVLSYELLAGTLPFLGPNFRHQHLHQDPPAITTISAPLATLVDECLFKEPSTRLTAENVLNRLRGQPRSATPFLSPGLTALQDANRAAAHDIGVEARRRSEALSESERRARLLPAARHQFGQISAELRQAILSVTPTAILRYDNMPSWQLDLNRSAIHFSGISAYRKKRDKSFDDLSEGLLSSSDKHPLVLPFEVVAYGHLAVGRSVDQSEHFHTNAGRAHSLWFCDAQEQGKFGWYEVAFNDQESMTDEGYLRSFLRPSNEDRVMGLCKPYALSPDRVEAARALGSLNNYWFVSWPFTPLEVDSLEEFIDRWANWLGASYHGLLASALAPRQNNTPRSWRLEGERSVERHVAPPKHHPASSGTTLQVPPVGNKRESAGRPTVKLPSSAISKLRIWAAVVTLVVLLGCALMELKQCSSPEAKFPSPQRTYFENVQATCQWLQLTSSKDWHGCAQPIPRSSSPYTIRISLTGISVGTWVALKSIPISGTVYNDGCRLYMMPPGKRTSGGDGPTESWVSVSSDTKPTFDEDYDNFTTTESGTVGLKVMCGVRLELAAEWEFKLLKAS